MAKDTNQPRLLIAEVCPRDFEKDEAATYVRIHNPRPEELPLAGWTLEWDGAPLAFPEGAILDGKRSCYVAYDASVFEHYVTRLPDYAITFHPDLGMMTASAARPASFRSEAGYVRLVSPEGDLVDALAWGDAEQVSGWEGPTLEPLGEGIVYQRAIQELTLAEENPGEFVSLVGRAEAWRQGTDWIARREARVAQSAYPAPTLEAHGAIAFTNPDNAYDVICEFIDAAQQTLDINLYLFTQPAIGEHVIEAHRRGVQVRILMEGEPWMGMPENNRDHLAHLQREGIDIRILHETRSGFDRYHFDHAKYALADGERCLVMSDNWTRTSVPERRITGQRGWGIILESPALHAYLTQIFEFDRNLRSPDCLTFDPEARFIRPAARDFVRQTQVPLAEAYPSERFAKSIKVIPVLAPEHAMLGDRGICGMMRAAQHTLDIQQQSVQLYWGFSDHESLETNPNLFLNEVIAAARRGVRVRLLMSGAHLNPNDPRDNIHTMNYLRDLAREEGLAIDVRILDEGKTRMGIHNKGLIADDRQVLISSINWTQNSPLYDRELAVIVDDHDVARYYVDLFNRDWSMTE